MSKEFNFLLNILFVMTGEFAKFCLDRCEAGGDGLEESRDVDAL